MEAIYYKQGFSIFRDLNKLNSIRGESLSFNSKRLEESILFLKKEGIKKIILGNDFFLEDLDFLAECNFIEGISILNSNIKDYSGLYNIKNLRSFQTEKLNNTVNFDQLLNLEVLGVDYSKNVWNLSACKNLNSLWLDNYKKDDLKEISSFKHLKNLSLFNASIRNLVGMETLTELQYLKLDSLKMLDSFTGLSDKSAKLQVIDVFNCKNLTNYDGISRVKMLKKLFLEKTGNSENLDFLKGLKNLSTVTIGFNVINGDLTCLDRVESIWFKDFPQYSYKMKNIDNGIPHFK